MSRLATMVAQLEQRQARAPAAVGPPVWQPQPGAQTLAYHSPADEMFYGGAAGGGKSDLLLGLALTAHRKSLILRREAAQLPEIVGRLHELLTAGDAWRSVGSGGTLQTHDGRALELAGCKEEKSKRKYQGRAHDLKAFDEFSEFSESQFSFICGWNRTVVPGQRCRIVGAGNPPTTAEGEWVLRRWGPWLDPQHPRPAQPAELRWYATVDGKQVECEDASAFQHKGETIHPRSRTFIPARLEDNPILAARGYGAVLASLPEPLRSQLRWGNFAAGLEDDAWQVIPSAWVIAAMRRWEEAGGKKPEGARLDCVGTDVARGGACQTVLSKRYANWFAPLEKHPGKSTPDGPTVAGLVLMALGDTPTARVHLDVIGVGASAYDSLKAVSVARLVLWAVNASAASERKDRSGTLSMRNLRAEGWWNLREALDPVKGDGLMLPPDRELLADLTAPRWKLSLQGVQVEAKEDLVARLGRSPDCGDAVVLAAMPSRTLPRGSWGMPRQEDLP